jgi:Holliday junction DNA helicase RuvA
MISRISGKLTQITEHHALVENAGFYYEVLLPSALADRLKSDGRVGSNVEFETIYYIEAGDKKSSHFPRLVGFVDAIDREFFSLFTQVSGMGVKKALKSLTLPISEIAAAIETKDSAQLTRLPGIGGRLAEKIIAELHGKTVKFALARHREPLAAAEAKPPAFVDDAVAILEQLQYTTSEARQMIEAVMKTKPKVSRAEEVISLVFRSGRQEGNVDK